MKCQNIQVYRARGGLFDAGLAAGIVPLGGQSEFSDPLMKIRMTKRVPVLLWQLRVVFLQTQWGPRSMPAPVLDCSADEPRGPVDLLHRPRRLSDKPKESGAQFFTVFYKVV
jgi:hypothetical protein